MSERSVSDGHLVVMLTGFAARIEDNSRGTFSDAEAHRALTAINAEASKTLAILKRPDLLAEVVGV